MSYEDARVLSKKAKNLALYLICHFQTDEINRQSINGSEPFGGIIAAECRENINFHGNASAEAFVQ